MLIPIHVSILGSVLGTSSSVTGSSFSLLGALKDIYIIVLVIVFLFGWIQGHFALSFSTRPAALLVWLLFLFANLIALAQTPSLDVGLWALRSVLEFSVTYFLALGLIRKSEDVLVLFRWILAGGAAIFIYSLYLLKDRQFATSYQLFGGSPTFIVGALTPFGDYTTVGYFAAYAALIVTIAVGLATFEKGWTRYVSFGIAAIGVVNILLGFERRGWLALIMGILCIFLFARQKFLVGALAAVLGSILVIVLLLNPTWLVFVDIRLGSAGVQDAIAVRSDIASSFLPTTFMDWALGQGLGVGSNTASPFVDTIYRPHNYYVLLLVQGGVILLLAFAILIVYVLSRTYWLLSNTDSSILDRKAGAIYVACLASLLVLGFVMDVGDVFPFNLYLWLFAGLVVAGERVRTNTILVGGSP
jgi:hypothetical protein